ncbi:hypothetical protein JCM10207_004568 [Rhodosporidiobolus poonsookiae]
MTRADKGKQRAMNNDADTSEPGQASRLAAWKAVASPSTGPSTSVPYGAVSAASLQAALVDLAASTSEPMTTPFPDPATDPSHSPANGTLPSGAPISHAATSSAHPSCNGSSTRRRSRLSSLADRFTPSRSPSSSRPREVEASQEGRPKQRRRFSRSLPSFTPNNQERRAPSSSTTAATAEATSPSRWKGKGKAKLLQLLKSRSSSTALSTTQLDIPLASTDDGRPARSSSRTRAYSAPLYLAHGQPIASPEQLDPVPSTDTRCVLPLEPADSTPASGFCTALASPTELCFPSTVSPSAAAAASAPAPEPEPEPDRFAVLPREVQLRIMRALLEVCEDEWREDVAAGMWRGAKTRDRWSDGRARGRRELDKVGRVSKLWRSLSHDGQLWATAPASSSLGPDFFDKQSLVTLFQHGGTFVRSFDAQGLGETLNRQVAEKLLEAAKGFEPTGTTRFTKIDLTGCTSLTSGSLSSLLCHSPDLVDLTVVGLDSVTSNHMTILGLSCSRLSRIDVSRCRNVAAPALTRLPYPPPKCSSVASSSSAVDFGGMRSIRAAGLSGMNGEVLVKLLERHPSLETFDVSCSSSLTDDDLRRAAEEPTPAPSRSPSPVTRRITSTRHQRTYHSYVLPPPAATPAPPKRRVYPSLRHLNLSSCDHLTSDGFAPLAGSLPNLEILELAGLGGFLRTDGLALLLSTCPKLRKLDLEDADAATDNAILALASFGDASQLTHLVISACPTVTDGAIFAVVLPCRKLRVLEADGTAISSATSSRFVKVAQKRLVSAHAAVDAEHGAVDPLVKAKTPAVLSILDNRVAARRLSRDVGISTIRPRHGQRGAWTATVGFYHDGDSDDGGSEAGETATRKKGKKGVLEECDEGRVVVRSFYTSLAVDAANALRESEAQKREATSAGPPGLRTRRALSDSAVGLRSAGLDGDGRGCVVS